MTYRTEPPQYVLIQVVPSRLEVMSVARQVTPAPFGLCPAVLVRRGDAWVMEEPRDPLD